MSARATTRGWPGGRGVRRVGSGAFSAAGISVTSGKPARVMAVPDLRSRPFGRTGGQGDAGEQHPDVPFEAGLEYLRAGHRRGGDSGYPVASA